jgi:hypothetical protein
MLNPMIHSVYATVASWFQLTTPMRSGNEAQPRSDSSDEGIYMLADAEKGGGQKCIEIHNRQKLAWLNLALEIMNI